MTRLERRMNNYHPLAPSKPGPGGKKEKKRKKTLTTIPKPRRPRVLGPRKHLARPRPRRLDGPRVRQPDGRARRPVAQQRVHLQPHVRARRVAADEVGARDEDGVDGNGVAGLRAQAALLGQDGDVVEGAAARGWAEGEGGGYGDLGVFFSVC